MTDWLADHGRALQAFGDLVRQVPTDGWHRPTPDTEWEVRDLVGHLTSEQAWAAYLVAGGNMEQAPDDLNRDPSDGDLLGDDPVAAWTTHAAAARSAWTADGALQREVELSGGPTPAEHYLHQMTMDLVVHSWDLARALGTAPPLPEQAITDVLDYLGDQDMSGSGLFGDPREVGADASPLDRLVAQTGRDPAWTP